ncbi:hypothetical protein [Streptomyces noursei]|uniref:hypothetical protein n=1 Tax=Streptomyces noursei TaxID=1971 RepID=UPI0033D8B4CD
MPGTDRTRALRAPRRSARAPECDSGSGTQRDFAGRKFAHLHWYRRLYARALPGFRINAVDPGFTATALNNHTGIGTPAQSAVTVAQIALAIDGPSGRLFDSTGQVGW